MENEIILHEKQEQALHFMEESIINGEHIIALIGAGGTGKSEILSRLLKIEGLNKTLFVSAATNKAVSRLKKDIKEVKTLHSCVAKPKYTALYINLEGYYEGLEEADDKQFFKSSYYLLPQTKKFLSDNRLDLDDHRTALDLISYVGKTVFEPEFFERYIVKERELNSVLIIDEASMVPNESQFYEGSLITIGVDTASKVFDQIILVGDNSQLPPIKGTSSFEGIPYFELTENFRSEKDLLRAIQWARDGKDFFDYKTNKDENVKVFTGISQEWYDRTFKKDNVTHIVYTNKTRHSIVQKVRKDAPEFPLEGEPVLYRGGSKGYISKGEIGTFKDGNVEFEGIPLKLKKYDHFDEYESKKYCRFQYGYAITAHMAQGSSFDHIIVHLNDIPFFIKGEERRKWIYTAISRAKKSITVIV